MGESDGASTDPGGAAVRALEQPLDHADRNFARR